MSKQFFFRSLSKLSTESSSTFSSSELFRTTGEFLRNVFDFCRHQGPVNLNDTEKQLVISQLSHALPILSNVIFMQYFYL
jgi:hypothetical protein